MDELILGIFSSESQIMDERGGKKSVLWHACYLDFKHTGLRFCIFRWWVDRKACIAEAREFVGHLAMDVDDTIVD